jgi:hypothetical protein
MLKLLKFVTVYNAVMWKRRLLRYIVDLLELRGLPDP